jgi:hypothetical protein
MVRDEMNKKAANTVVLVMCRLRVVPGVGMELWVSFPCRPVEGTVQIAPVEATRRGALVLLDPPGLGPRGVGFLCPFVFYVFFIHSGE